MKKRMKNIRIFAKFTPCSTAKKVVAWLRNEVPPMASDWKKAWAICAPTKNKMAQMAICTIPKRPIPMILPSISS